MASEKREPVGGRQAFSFVHNNQFYVCRDRNFVYSQVSGKKQYQKYRDGGYSEEQLLPLQLFDFFSGQWSSVSPVCADPEPEEKHCWTEYMGYGMCCAVLGNCAYTFGGFWKYGYAVHELNLEKMVWRRLEPQNREDGPMNMKRWAGMVACGDEALCVFGGHGIDTGRHQPGATYQRDEMGCWTNELHVFNTNEGTWSSPETSGTRPPPCQMFSFSKVDLSHAVLFGGEQRHQIVNEVHILDMNNWHWSGAILPSSPADLWPQARCRHSACVLFAPTPSSASEGFSKALPHSPSSDIISCQHKPHLFVLWGVGHDEHNPVTDAWTLDVSSITWKQVKLPSDLGPPRTAFSLGCYNHSPTDAELVLFGGMDSLLKPVGYTALLYLGVKSLYHSCVDYVAERYELYQPLLQQLLPPHIQTDISQEKDKRVCRAHYRVAQL